MTNNNSTDSNTTKKCPVCGCIQTKNGNWFECYNCGYGEILLPHKYTESAVPDLIENDKNPYIETQGGAYGWICPKCGRGLSPWTSFCPCSSNGLGLTWFVGE